MELGEAAGRIAINGDGDVESPPDAPDHEPADHRSPDHETSDYEAATTTAEVHLDEILGLRPVSPAGRDTVAGADATSPSTGSSPEPDPAVTGSYDLFGEPEVAHGSSARELPGRPLPPGVQATGPLVIPTVPPRPPRAPRAVRGLSPVLILQAIIVALSALAVGLLVFVGLRSALGSPEPDGEGGEIASPTTIAPGPADLGLDNSSRSTSDEGRSEFDVDRGDRTEPTTAADLADAVSTTDDVANITSPPTLPSTVPTAPTSAVSTTTTSPSSSTSASTTSTASTTPSTTIVSTTASTTPTSAVTTTTRPTTTSTQPPPFAILTPLDQSRPGWERDISFEAQPLLGADRYCWRFEGITNRMVCGDEPSYVLPASATLPGPGPVEVEASAKDSAGTVLAIDTVSIWIVARTVITEPLPDTMQPLDRRLGLRARSVPNATRYCWTLSQEAGAITSGEFCGVARNVSLPPSSPLLDGFEPGKVSVRLRILHGDTGSVLVGNQVVTFELVAVAPPGFEPDPDPDPVSDPPSADPVDPVDPADPAPVAVGADPLRI